MDDDTRAAIEQLERTLRDEIQSSAVETRVYVDERIQASALETRGYVDTSTARRIDESEARVRRHFDVVAEALRGDIRALAEGLALWNERLGARATEQGERTDRLEGRVVGLEARVSTLEDAARPRRRRRR